MQILFGRMVHSNQLNRGVIDKSYQMKKIAVGFKNNYSSLLSTCIRKLWDENVEKNSRYPFYLADSTSARIEPPLNWVVTDSTNELEWCLENYLKLSGRYPSKLRHYCVMVKTKTGIN